MAYFVCILCFLKKHKINKRKNCEPKYEIDACSFMMYKVKKKMITEQKRKLQKVAQVEDKTLLQLALLGLVVTS